LLTNRRAIAEYLTQDGSHGWRCPLECRLGKWGNARSFDGRVEPAVEATEVFVVRPVTRCACAKHIDNQGRRASGSANAASDLDVLARCFRLPNDRHETKPRNIKPDFDH